MSLNFLIVLTLLFLLLTQGLKVAGTKVLAGVSEVTVAPTASLSLTPMPTVSPVPVAPTPSPVVKFPAGSGLSFRCPAGTQPQLVGNEIFCFNIGNVGVGTTVIVGTKELPRTGFQTQFFILVSILIPFSIALSNFAKVPKLRLHKPSFLWEEKGSKNY